MWLSDITGQQYKALTLGLAENGLLWNVPHFWSPPSLWQSAHHSLFPSIITITRQNPSLPTSAHIACIPTCSTTVSTHQTIPPTTHKIENTRFGFAAFARPAPSNSAIAGHRRALRCWQTRG